jgi:hypothetical protein
MDPCMTALLAALSLQAKAEQYGAYAGIAAVFGLGVLSLLYFAQAREVKRLREWAGRAPERAAEIEARVIAEADERRAAPAPAAATAAATAAAATAANGAPAQAMPHPGLPASAPGAPARAPGVPASLPAAAIAAATAAGARGASALAESGEPERGVPVSTGAGTATLPPPTVVPGGPPATGAPDAPAPIVPEPRRSALVNGVPARTAAGARNPVPPAPRSAPLRAGGSQATLPPRTAAAAAGRGHGAGGPSGGRSRRAIAGIVAAVVAVAAVAVVAAVTLLGGSSDNAPPPKPNTVAPPASASTPPSSGGNNSSASTPAKVNRGGTVVAVLNGTTFTGLARSASDKLTAAGFKPGVVTNDTTNQTRSATAIFYADKSQRPAALEVAKIIGIGTDAVQPLDQSTRTLAGEDADVVVSVGADQAR